jgi:hypothetical protein
MSPLGNAALALAGKGFAVFPLRPRTKEPYGDDKFFRTVGGYKCASRDPALIEFWWGRQPEANIGLATGSVSGIWILDVDGDQGRETLATLEEQHGQLPATVEVVTPGKISKKTVLHSWRGLHLYFRYPLGLDIRNGQDRDDLPGIDWRGNGGYALLPPSGHPDGGVYAWSVDSADTFADAPPWLIELVTSRPADDSSARPAMTPAELRTFIEDTYEGSHRARAIASLSGYLLRHWVDPNIALSLCQMFNTAHCIEPLTWNEVLRIVHNIAGREAERLRKERTGA